MSGKVYSGNSFVSVLNKFETELKESKAEIEAIRQTFTRIINTYLLQGNAYNEHKQFILDAVFPFLNLHDKYFDALIRGCDTFPSDFEANNSELTSTSYVDTTKLQKSIEYNKHQKKILTDLILNSDFTHIRLSDVDYAYDTTKIEKILNDLETYDSKSASVFSEAIAYWPLLDKGIEAIDLANKNKDYTFNSEKSNVFKQIVFIQEYNIYIPPNLNSEQVNQYIGVLMKEEKELKSDGWDKSAIKAYFNRALNGGTFNERILDSIEALAKGEKWTCGIRELKNFDEIMNKLDESFSDTKKVGSKLFTVLFENMEDDKKKVELVLNVMQASKVNEENPNMTLGKNGYKFDEDLDPNNKFWLLFSDAVVNGYDSESDEYQRVSQFRMYIDKQNIDYVRSHGTGATDYEKLVSLYGDIPGALYYGEPSRFHNRCFESVEKIVSPQINDKILLNDRHCEFIINTKTGDFNTQWDVIAYDANGEMITDSTYYDNLSVNQQLEMVNTESFNYAEPSIGKGKTHREYDVNPVGENNTSHNEWIIKQDLKNIWKSLDDDDGYTEAIKSSDDYEKFINSWHQEGA